MSAFVRLYRVSGIVQGVGFRNATKRAADACGLYGYAINLNDGRVEVLVLGGDESLADFDQWLREEGPPRATIEDIERLPPEQATRTAFVTGVEG